MIITKLKVEYFGCVQHASVEFGPGVNVLYGRNDLGKSTLARAIRAAFLVPHTSAVAKEYVSWAHDENPTVEMTIKLADHRYWRIVKRFAGGGSGSSSQLLESKDGTQFSPYKKGREVDEEMRNALRWGIPARAKQGLPNSFLSNVILGEQADVAGILSDSLHTDSHESGKKQLTNALAALAQNPEFKRILSVAQERVDRAFTAKGRRRNSKTSPFTQAAEDVKQLNKELDFLTRTVAASNDAQSVFHECTTTLTLRQSEVQQATIEQQKWKTAVEHAKQRQVIIQELQSEKSKFSAQQEQLNSLRNLEQHFNQLQSQVQIDIARQEIVKQEVANATSEHSDVVDSLKRANSEQAQQEQHLRTLELESKQNALTVKFQSNAQSRADFATLQEHHNERMRFRKILAKNRSEREQREVQKQSCQSEIAAKQKEFAVANLAVTLSQLHNKRHALSSMHKTAEDIATSRSQIAEAKNAIQVIEDKIRTDLPTQEEMTSVAQLLRDLELAKAKIGGGLAVQIERIGEINIETHSDDSASNLYSDEIPELTAERTLTLHLEDIAKIRITAGRAEARALVQTLQTRVEKEVSPLYQRLEISGYEELVECAKEQSKHREMLLQLQSNVSQKSELVSVQESSLISLDTLESEVDRLRSEVGNTSTTEAQSLLDRLGELNLQAHSQNIKDTITQLQQMLEREQESIRTMETEQQVLQERILATESNIAKVAHVPLEPEWPEYQSTLHRESLEIEKAQANLAKELCSLSAKTSAQSAQLEALVAQAKQRLDVAIAAMESHSIAHAERTKQANTLEGELNAKREAASTINIAAIQGCIDAIEKRLAQLPAIELKDGENEYNRATEIVEQAIVAQTRARDEVRKAEGALQSMGGQVAREQLENTQDALTIAEAREEEVRIEFDAWKLLAEKLRESENTEGQHLGEALSIPLGKRFSELSGNRYNTLQIAPNLETEHIQVAGVFRDLHAFSVGTQEQLATLLRLTIAEQLGCMLVLDDNLTQTDPERSLWFRTIMRKHAHNAQIIVLTCHPRSYLQDSEMPDETSNGVVNRAAGQLCAIDMGKIVTRC